MLPAFLAALTWVPPILGLGALIRHDGDPELRPWVAGLLGFGVLGVAAVLAHFAVAVGPWVSASFWCVGLVALAWRRRWLFAGARGWHGLAGVTVLAGATAILYPPQTHYDMGFYYLQAIRWMTDASLYLGTANVHDRLGFNGLAIAIAAGLEHPLAIRRSAFFMNQLPVAFATITAMIALVRLAKGDRSFHNLLLAGAVFPAAAALREVGSQNPDYTVGIVLYLSLVWLARALEAPPERFVAEAYPATLLSILAILLKISSVPMAAAILVAVALRGRAAGALPSRSSPAERPRTGRGVAARPFLWFAIVAAIAVLPWLVRSVLLSGCLAYPLRATCLPSLSWTVPEAVTASQATWIRSWARIPGTSPEDVLTGWGWIPGWLRGLREYGFVLAAAWLVALGLAAWAFTRRRPTAAFAGALAVAAVGCAAWFVAAPSPRFGVGPLLSFALVLPCHALSDAPLLDRRPFRAALAAALVAGAAMIALEFDVQVRADPVMRMGIARRWAPLLDWPALPVPPIVTRATASGLLVQVPAIGEQCWATPIPCAPQLDPSLRFDGAFVSGPPR